MKQLALLVCNTPRLCRGDARKPESAAADSSSKKTPLVPRAEYPVGLPRGKDTRCVLFVLMIFAALLFRGVEAGENMVSPQLVSKKECKKINGKCVKKPIRGKKQKTKKRSKPLAPIEPTIEKEYSPPIFKTDPRKQFAVYAYQKCMYGEISPLADRIEYALLLNLSYRDERIISGSPEKLGREVCLSDALGLKRYETQEDIDRAKGTELFEVSAQFIDFPDDEGNSLPPERRFARPWVKEYIETFARDLYGYLSSQRKGGMTDAVPRLRVTSLVRSLVAQSQQHSPAKCKNEICSTHLTGSTVDIANSGARVSAESRKWIRERLLQDRKDGKIIMIEEFARPHYHVFVIPPEFVSAKDE